MVFTFVEYTVEPVAGNLSFVCFIINGRAEHGAEQAGIESTALDIGTAFHLDLSKYGVPFHPCFFAYIPERTSFEFPLVVEPGLLHAYLREHGSHRDLSALAEIQPDTVSDDEITVEIKVEPHGVGHKMMRRTVNYESTHRPRGRIRIHPGGSVPCKGHERI